MGSGVALRSLRGGNWNNGGNAGLGALNLNNDRSNANSNIGLRLARLSRPEAGRPRPSFPCLIHGCLILGRAPENRDASRMWYRCGSLREAPTLPRHKESA